MIRKNLVGALTRALITSVFAAFALAGCGASTPVDHNDADVAFARGMLPHHQGAIDMAKLVEERSENPSVIALAKRIASTQGPEITTLTRWLTEWDVPAQEMAHGDTKGNTHGDTHGDTKGDTNSGTNGDTQGGDESAELTPLSGEVFDRRFLELMIKHHEGAISMASDELRDGRHTAAKALAQQVKDSQQAEITEMRGLLERTG
ncbi:DUF305 domain-containing protein [Actinosynnema sp. NPDC020468]|uniref:DUF305 domain-containing protein n=1 Tax=Actinosynnema sp. NPDC020468 TaxID=3154488 RepID=UPI0033C263AD